MLATCSPTSESRGTMQFQSPSQSTEYDPHSAIREIRRSLSRSPSKPFSFRPPVSNGASPLFPSPLSPSRRSGLDHTQHLTPFTSPHASRFTPHARLQRPTIRRTTQSVSRTRTSPKSPTKRILTESNDFGNSTPMLRKRSSSDIDEDLDLTTGQDKENLSAHNDDQITVWKTAQTRQERRRSGGLLTETVPLSPMKRSDGAMNLDQPDRGSPSAKRRSLHAPSMLDFSIFESDNLKETLDENRSQDDNDWFRSSSSSSGGRFSTIPKRSSSLRKSTLQQRQNDKHSPLRFPSFSELSREWYEPTPATSRKPVRISLDNHLAPMQRDSPFSSQGSLLNASIHPLGSSQEKDENHNSNSSSQQSTHFRHPLSRTMTQSSSTPSVQDDSPTHEPIRRPDRPKSHDFSKSLPIGAIRPVAERPHNQNELSSQGSFATPANYKFARPLPAAFMSTGLISKKNRNVDEPDAGLPKAHMPDTPCKKQSLIFPANSKNGPSHVAVQNIRDSFGTPRSPSDAAFGVSRASPFPWAKNTSIFGARSRPALTRKTSFASLATLDAEEKVATQSPSYQGDSQSTDTDYPPTPTKHMDALLNRPASVSPSPKHTMHYPQVVPTSVQARRFSNSKLSPIQASPNKVDGDSDSMMEDSPSAKLKPKSLLSVMATPASSYTQTRQLRNLNSPTPLSRKTSFPLSMLPSVSRRTKLARSPVTPHLNELDTGSPHTPSEGFFPPDPSALSISGKLERPTTRQDSIHTPFIPATPTGPREYFGNFSNRPSLNLNAPDVADVDQSLTSRFQKVDLIGTGEFSQVYRVSNPPGTSPFHRSSWASSRPSSCNSAPEKVWAVKKSRHPYSGPKDRARKVHEVDVLKTLGHNDHIVTFVESWEDRGHLYIQTEFCEEGTLDVFLAQAGLKARLDDFRIWKILLELSQGLMHIHETGFIHLDLKPANVLITFEGVLKIADFGMATKWPAKSGIDGEGDREYIGPEILMGKYDKPADVFALGLMMLETAGNVELPDNGLSWQKLRNGDLSDVPSLTWSSEDSNILRDASGQPLDDESGNDNNTEFTNNEENDHLACGPSKTSHMTRSGELLTPPAFMVDASNAEAIDRIVRWMISPNPSDRPVIHQVLQSQGVQWVEARRRAGATIFEGNWGPADEVLAEDAEMIDV